MSGERGSVTVEWALAVPVTVVMMVVVGVTLMRLTTDKLVCVSTTRDAVLGLARGGDPPLPDGAVVSRDGATVTVSVHRAITGCSATAVREP